MSDMIQEPIEVFFKAAQRGLNPLRRRGAMGTSSDPRFYCKGDVVPWWVQCRWPLDVSLTFTVDCETFWEAGAQRLHPLWTDEPNALMHLDGFGGRDVLLVGAPTHFHGKRRPRGPKPQPKADHCSLPQPA